MRGNIRDDIVGGFTESLVQDFVAYYIRMFLRDFARPSSAELRNPCVVSFATVDLVKTCTVSACAFRGYWRRYAWICWRCLFYMALKLEAA